MKLNSNKIKKSYLLTAMLTLGILSPGVTHAQMFWNYSCRFEGNNSSYLAIANSNILNQVIDRGIFTVELWLCPVFLSQSPVTQVLIQKGDGNNPVGFCLYLNQSRVAFKTNNVTRLTGSSLISFNKWTHVAVSYNKVSSEIRIYINGLLDTSGFAPGTWTTPNDDSLYIAKGSEPPFYGMMDDIRLWDSELLATTISRNFRSTLATMSGNSQNGIYTGLVISLPFQKNYNSQSIFSLTDWSGNGHTAFNRGAVPVNQTDRPYNTITFNEALDFRNGGYAASPPNMFNSPVSAITLECWAYVVYWQFYFPIVVKGGINNGDYGFNISQVGTYMGMLNTQGFASGVAVKYGEWTHLAMTYNAGNSAYRFYVNGELVDSRTLNLGNLNVTNDSLYLQGRPNQVLIDELRISDYVKSQIEIKQYMFQSIDSSNNPSSSQFSFYYNFDGYAVPSNTVPFLNSVVYFRGNAGFSNPGTLDNVPVSPLERRDVLHFPVESDGWYVKRVFEYGNNVPQIYRSIPQANSQYISEDTMNIDEGSAMLSDVNFFVGLNFTNTQNLRVKLYSPDGDSDEVCMSNTQMGRNNNVVTIFDDGADSLLLNGRYVSFGPAVKPLNGLNSRFSGKYVTGTWKVRIYDINPPTDTGKFYCWGLQFETMAGIKGENENTISAFRLLQNYPNPFNPVTKIKFEMPFRNNVTLKIYDIIGREITILLNEPMNAGSHEAEWNASGYPSGVYFYKLITDDFVETKKMILAK